MNLFIMFNSIFRLFQFNKKSYLRYSIIEIVPKYLIAKPNIPSQEFINAKK